MAELIAIGITQADSADFTVAAGEPKALYIKYAGATAFGANPTPATQFLLQHKTPSADYITVMNLDATNIAQFGNVVGAGTFRVRRLANNNAVGMDIE